MCVKRSTCVVVACVMLGLVQWGPAAFAAEAA
jgi:hypothetical protein